MPTAAQAATTRTAAAYRPIRVQTVLVGASSAQIANSVGKGIRAIRVCSRTNCHYAVGDNPVATVNDSYLPADLVEYLSVREGEKIAFIQDSEGGTAYITEMSQ